MLPPYREREQNRGPSLEDLEAADAALADRIAARIVAELPRLGIGALCASDAERCRERLRRAALGSERAT